MPARPAITALHKDTLEEIQDRYRANPSDPVIGALIARANEEGEGLINVFALVNAMVHTGTDSRRVRDLKRDRRYIRWNDTSE